MPREQEIAWAAGLFEGEGCLTVATERAKKSRGAKRHVAARLGSTDLDIVERFASIVGVGRVHHNRRPKGKPHWKPMYEWVVQNAAGVRDVIDLLRPFFGTRRSAKAEEVYRAALLIRPYGERVTHCPHGHAYVGDNIIEETYRRNGVLRTARRCRTCHNARQRKARQVCSANSHPTAGERKLG